MDQAAREAFLRVPRTAVLSTTGPGARIHAVPVWFLLADGEVRILTERGSQKHRNVVREPRASLCVDEREGSFPFVTVEGPVSVIDVITGAERFALWAHYRGEEAARAMVDGGGHERMVMLILHPERWLG
ncbi:MAG: PPOX class F420-dependent oxidoreductase [Tepidiformaceae bacterium]